MPAPRLLRLLPAAVLLMAAATSEAASLQVAPTQVRVPAGRAADGLTLANNGSSPLQAQVRAYLWTQQDGKDVLVPTRDIAVSPPMVGLAGGATQLVRVVRLGPPPQDGAEAAYRILVDELPPADDTGRKPGLNFVLQYSIPVFLAPAGDGPVEPRLEARITREGGTATLELSNHGNGHARIADLVFERGDGSRLVIAQGLAGYVLPGSHRRWPVPDDAAPGQAGAFKARVNGETEERTLAVHPPPH